jgi:hypothetical protein
MFRIDERRRLGLYNITGESTMGNEELGVGPEERWEGLIRKWKEGYRTLAELTHWRG